MRQAIAKNVGNFVAVLLLIVVAIAVSTYILGNQRFNLPGWIPGSAQFFELKGEFSTAQAVTPGQGQTVTIAGVTIGEIAQVRLKDGKAVIYMDIEEDRAELIHRDASALLRPKTGLKDMVVELTPGTEAAGRMRDGDTIPISRTMPDVNFDEILATLDGDTRQYLQLLVGGAGEGLRENGRNLSATFKRFEPLGRDLRKITTKLESRKRNIARTIHNFSQLSSELGTKDDQLAELIDNSNAVFAAFAEQDQNIRATLRELPTTLQETGSALGKVDGLARELGPTLAALRPGARGLGPSLRASRPFLRQTTPVIRDQLRPFARQALGPVRDLRPAVRDLARVTPALDETFSSLNYLLNALAYNPPGKDEEGYLFWVAWLNHLGASIFSTQDAHGLVRRGSIQVPCKFLPTLNAIEVAADPATGSQGQPLLYALTSLLDAPQASEVCPQAAAAPAGLVPGKKKAR